MEQPSRRRRPVTYGKSTRKRISEMSDFAGLSEIFASPRAPPSHRPESPEREPVKARISQARQAAKPTGVDKQTSKPNIKPARPAPPQAASDREDSSDEEPFKKPADSLSIRTKAPEVAEKTAASKPPAPPADTGIFDVPSSEDEDSTLPASPRVQKRKRNLQTATATVITSREKAPVKREPVPVVDTLAEEMAPNGKRPRPARSVTEPVTRKIIPDAKITKPTRNQAPQEAAEKRQKAEKVEKPVAVSAKSAQAARLTATRPVTRKPAETPEVRPKVAPAATARRPPAPRRTTSTSQNPSGPSKPVLLKKPANEVVSAESQGGFIDGLDELMDGYLPPAGTLVSGMHQKPASPTRPQLRKANTDAPKTHAMDLDFLGDSGRTPSPPRKRLIDSLGGNPSRPAKRSCTSSGSDDGEDSSVSGGATNESQSQPLGSQSQTLVAESQQDQGSQEVEVLTVPKPSLAAGRVGPKITYARERSYRVEEATLDEMALLSMPLPSMSTYGGRRRLETKKADEDVVDDGSRPTGVKTIHELRAAGEHSRFADDLEEILGDVDPKQPVSLQRNAYHKLTTKLSDKKFLQKCRAGGFDERILTKLDLITDEIISYAVSFIALCLLHDDTTPRTMLQLFNNGARQMLVRMLSNPKDIMAIARDRKTNMSRAARESVGDLVTLVKGSPAFPESAKSSILSPQLMALKVLETLVRKLREYGNHDNILPQGAVNTLAGIVAPFANVTEYPRTSGNNSRISTLELALSILESYSLGGRVEFGRELSQEELKSLAAVFPTMLNWAQGISLGADHDLGMSILIAIRLYINISNDQAGVSDVIGPLLTPVLVSLVKKSFAVLEGAPEEQERKAYQDILILSFGLLLNFAEISAVSRECVRTTAVSEDPDATGIEVLLTIFTAKLQKTAEAQSVEETEANVGWGYLSILLGELCRDDHVRYRIRSQLNGGLKPLVEAIEEFIAYNKTVDGVLESAAHKSLTARFQEIVDRLRSYG